MKWLVILGIVAMVVAGVLYTTTAFRPPETIPQTEKVAEALAASGLGCLFLVFMIWLLDPG
jgi:hypothetical protein